ncbi:MULTISPECIES: hypothetical protein [unclassified Variovorax]|uniref:hypothetical protein n=1 Tax=unclassified Variovorax TaxID=663243 RepID=UPI001BD2AB49|nr:MULTISPECIES: hypothetical protein [unclassified Variovorax]
MLALGAPATAADERSRLSTMSDTELEAGMKSGVQRVLQQVPIRMGDQATLIGAEYESRSRVATYHYIRPGGVDSSALRSRITAKNCNTPNVRALLARGVTFRHLYMVGDQQVDFSVTQRDCLKVS